MFLRVILIVTFSSFILLNNTLFCEYETFCLSSHLSIDGHLSWLFFFFLYIMNNVAVNICEQVFVWTWVLIYLNLSGVELLALVKFSV